MKNLLNLAPLACLTFAVLSGVGQQTATAQNPIVDGAASSSITYDPFSDHTYIENNRTSVRKSFFDFNRHNVDPGSYKYVDRTFRDSNGQLVREFGHTWTTQGKPHGELTREKITTFNPSPGNFGCYPRTTIYDQNTVKYSQQWHNWRNPGSGGVTVHDRETVLYSKVPPGNGQPAPGGTTIRDRETVLFSRVPPKSGSNDNRRGGLKTRTRNRVQFKGFSKRK